MHDPHAQFAPLMAENCFPKGLNTHGNSVHSTVENILQCLMHVWCCLNMGCHPQNKQTTLK